MAELRTAAGLSGGRAVPLAFFEKHFTPEEASALLPELRDLISTLRGLRGRLSVEWKEAAPTIKVAHQNGGGKQVGPYVHSLARLNATVRRLVDMGVQLKDLDRGLVDFPAWRGDDEVLLCWQMGEDDIRYWHSLEGGFAGRQPL